MSSELNPDDLRLFVSNMAAMSAELKTEREIRAKERAEGISVLRLHVPLAVMLIAVSVLVSAGVAGGMFMRATTAHVENRWVHADENTSIAKGGIAYSKDVKDELASAVSDLEAGQRRIGRAVRATRCAPDRHGVISCNVPDPETLPLRP